MTFFIPLVSHIYACWYLMNNAGFRPDKLLYLVDIYVSLIQAALQLGSRPGQVHLVTDIGFR